MFIIYIIAIRFAWRIGRSHGFGGRMRPMTERCSDPQTEDLDGALPSENEMQVVRDYVDGSIDLDAALRRMDDLPLPSERRRRG